MNYTVEFSNGQKLEIINEYLNFNIKNEPVNGENTVYATFAGHEEEAVATMYYIDYLVESVELSNVDNYLTAYEYYNGRYGFFEAVDFSQNQSPCMVRCFMSHHIGMSFLAAVNCIYDNIMQKRFMADEKMQGCYSLLEEKIPSDVKSDKKKPCIHR